MENLSQGKLDHDGEIGGECEELIGNLYASPSTLQSDEYWCVVVTSCVIMAVVMFDHGRYN
ncbi:hypothetical protein Bca4012_023861 [Brassica carinata]|uniref:Uncharacterized protein n=1 Tax=Brassica carinata TaxID=52824 RepID=A0A8X7NVI1_BRACI|nr:hypothetical protein Bca52824_089953 [Brassica carinata]